MEKVKNTRVEKLREKLGLNRDALSSDDDTDPRARPVLSRVSEQPITTTTATTVPTSTTATTSAVSTAPTTTENEQPKIKGFRRLREADEDIGGTRSGAVTEGLTSTAPTETSVPQAPTPPQVKQKPTTTTTTSTTTKHRKSLRTSGSHLVSKFKDKVLGEHVHKVPSTTTKPAGVVPAVSVAAARSNVAPPPVAQSVSKERSIPIPPAGTTTTSTASIPKSTVQDSSFEIGDMILAAAGVGLAIATAVKKKRDEKKATMPHQDIEGKEALTDESGMPQDKLYKRLFGAFKTKTKGLLHRKHHTTVEKQLPEVQQPQVTEPIANV